MGNGDGGTAGPTIRPNGALWRSGARARTELTNSPNPWDFGP